MSEFYPQLRCLAMWNDLRLCIWRSRLDGANRLREEDSTMNTKIFVVLAGFAVAGTAQATFTGYSVIATTVGALTKYQLYGNFNGATDTVLNAFNFDGTAGQCPVFHHNEFSSGVDSTDAGGWNPQFTTPGAFDSYVSIGGGEGFGSGNSTGFDPSSSYNQPQLPCTPSSADDLSWFNSNPPNHQGRVVGGQVRLGQFVLGANDASVTLFLKIGYNSGVAGAPVQFAEGNFTLPAPGAIALLGLAGLTGRRRR